MRPDPPPPPGPDPTEDAAALAAHARALADGVEAAIAPWVERVVAERAVAAGAPLDGALIAAARRAGEAARAEVGPQVRALLETDVDAQRRGPLELVRLASVHASQVLREAGVPPVERDDMARRLHPDDEHDLVIASFADLDPAVGQLGIVWGAAKAHVILARRRRQGLR